MIVPSLGYSFKESITSTFFDAIQERASFNRERGSCVPRWYVVSFTSQWKSRPI